VLLLLSDGTQVPVTELPGTGPWTFLILQADPDWVSGAGSGGRPGPSSAGPDPVSAGPEPGGVARFLIRFGRAVVPDLRGRPGWGERPGGPGFLDLVDDLDQVRTRAGLGRPILVGVGELAAVALQAADDQPWAWRALIVGRPAAGPAARLEPGRLDLPALVLEAEPLSAPDTAAVERLLGGLGEGPGWSGIAPDAPPR
jgi:pimeloyl-ACP methyl ester carboxylesterase